MTTAPINIRSIKAFEKWDKNSSVRTRQNRYSICAQDLDPLNSKNWFPPQMLKFLEHPYIAGLPKKIHHIAQANYLVHFLDHTTLLEHTIVNRAVETISHDLKFNENIRKIGLKIYTDEAYHALFSRQLADEVAAHFHVKRLPSSRIASLESLASNVANHQPLASFLVGFVSETVIAKELTLITRRDLVEPVYRMFCDHLHDEARHAQFFSDCFVWLWGTLAPPEQAFAAKLIPHLLKIFSEIDETWLRCSLQNYRIPPNQEDEIVKYCQDGSIGRTRTIATTTLNAVKQTNMLNNSELAEHFRHHGIL